MSAVSFIVPGDPRPKGRPRAGKGFVYTPRETVLAEHTVKAHARRAKVRPLVGDIAIELRFYRATRRRCDWDNLAKLVCDALNGIAWRDDDQIVLALIGKAHDPVNPRTEVTVRLAEHIGGGADEAVEDAERKEIA
jgi:crossover junction endodeoxyribonuclease RusA